MVNPSPDFWKNKKVFVTGHTGFKGVWLSHWLLHLGAEVSGFSLEPSEGQETFLRSSNLKKVKNYFGDIRNKSFLEESLKKTQPDIVLHLAAQALVRPSYEDPVMTYETNVMGTVHMLELCRHLESVRVVVNITSDKCYENKESPWWGYREVDPMGGCDPYSNSKGCSELVTSSYQKSFYKKLEKGLASVRAGNVIGGGDWSIDRIVPDCVRAIKLNQSIVVRRPHSIRPWQHVLEPLSGYLILTENVFKNPSRFSEGWNFGPQDLTHYTVGDLVTEFVKNWPGASWINKENPDDFYEATYLKLDCSKAMNLLNWKSRLNFKETVNWTVDWYKNQQNQSSESPLIIDQIEKYEKHNGGLHG